MLHTISHASREELKQNFEPLRIYILIKYFEKEQSKFWFQ